MRRKTARTDAFPEASEELKNGLSAAYSRVQAIFLVIVSLCAYLALAAFDRTTVASLNRELWSAHRLWEKAKQQLEVAHGNLARQLPRIQRGCDAWSKAFDVSMQCTETCLRLAATENCNTERQQRAVALRKAEERIASVVSLEQKLHVLELEALKSARTLSAAASEWEHTADPKAQPALQRAFKQARLHDAGLRDKLAFTRKQTTSARRAALVVNQDSSAAREFIDTQAELAAAERDLREKEAVSNELASKHVRLREQLDESMRKRMKLPVIDVEIDRDAFNIFAPLLTCALFLLFYLYVRQVQRSILRSGLGGVAASQQDELAQFPWPLLLDPRRKAQNRWFWLAGASIPVLVLGGLACVGDPSPADCCAAAGTIMQRLTSELGPSPWMASVVGLISLFLMNLSARSGVELSPTQSSPNAATVPPSHSFTRELGRSVGARTKRRRKRETRR